jgi:hypothetical protein
VPERACLWRDVWFRSDRNFGGITPDILLVGADIFSYWAMWRQWAQVSRDDQCQRYFIIYLHKFCYTNSISYNTMHNPGEVTWSDGTISPATCWDDYALAPDAMHGSAKGAVWSNFRVSFSVIPFHTFIPDAPDFGTAWFWNCRDNSACKVKTCGTTREVCSRRVLTSLWVKLYQTDGFVHRTSTWRHLRGSNWARSTMVHIWIWLKNNIRW